MYQSTFSLTIPKESTNVLLFKNPTLSTIAVRFETCAIDYETDYDSIWKVYLNPTVTSNGTLQTNINISTTIASQGLIYKSPVTTADGIHLRSFVINKGFDYFTLLIPVLQLEAGNTILIKKTSSEARNTADIDFKWRELI